VAFGVRGIAPLWDRLKLADRLISDDAGLESNVRFLRPHDEVVAMWRRCVMHAYDPERLFARFAYQVDATFAHRLDVPAQGKLTEICAKPWYWPSILSFGSGFYRIIAARSGAQHITH
jgi:hypothetical protein